MIVLKKPLYRLNSNTALFFVVHLACISAKDKDYNCLEYMHSNLLPIR